MTTKVYYGQPVFKHPSEQLVYYFKFSSVLPSGVTVASAAMSEQSGNTGLTIGSATILGADETIDGVTLPANETAKVLITGGTDNTDYEAVCLATLSNGEKPALVGTIQVRA